MTKTDTMVIPQEKYMVAYAKIIIDKDSKISLAGVFFGGIGGTPNEAESMAKECVNTVRGGVILPRVIKLEQDGQVIDALYDATDRFERVTADMIESDQITSRSRKRKS